MSGSIAALTTVRPPRALRADVCIVGSGSAGATAAWELASAGRDVVVLEEGGDYTGLALTQRDGRMHDQLYMDRGGRATSDLSISVLQGRVLGGGGVINACDVVPIGEGVTRFWQRRFGLGDLSFEALRLYRDRALADLSANVPRDDQINENNRLLRRGAEALGLRGEVMQHNRVGCAGTGTCLLGCPLDAKKNPRFVAIPGAVAAGARFYTRARAVRIEGLSRREKTVHVRTLDRDGYHEREEATVRADVVVLAANAIASTQLLMRSGHANPHLGRHVSLQPQLPITARFDEDVRFFRGIPQTYAVIEHERLEDDEHGWWGFRIEAIGGTPGVVASMLPRLGHDGKALMSVYPRLAASLLLLPDDPRGVVRLEDGERLRIDYALDDEQVGRYREAAKAAARIYLAAGARDVLVPTVPPVLVRSERDLARIDGISFRPTSAPFISAHQQGGTRMASSERDGVTSPDGLVWGARDVYVFDSGVFPSSASSHTMAPIITVARYLARKLVARGARAA